MTVLFSILAVHCQYGSCIRGGSPWQRHSLPTSASDGQVPVFDFDAGYGAALTDTAGQVLVRIRGDRVSYTDPNGRPRRHCTRFASVSARWTAVAARDHGRHGGILSVGGAGQFQRADRG